MTVRDNLNTNFRYFYYTTIALIVLTFILLLWGGSVHNTGSSLACPDWPLCYGEVFPTMKGSIFIEHGHRLLASLVGFLCIILVVLSKLIASVSKKLFFLTLFILAIVILQGMLGGLTVIYKLPTIVSTLHLTFSMIFFSSLIYLLFSIREKESPYEIKAASDLDLRKFKNLYHSSLILFVMIFAQIVYGGFIRHVGAGGACGTGVDSTLLCMDLADNMNYKIVPTDTHGLTHMIHRYMAMMIAVFSFSYYFYAKKSLSRIKSFDVYQTAERAFRLLKYVLVLVVVQIFLGLLTIATHISYLPTTLHLGVAALILAMSFYIYLLLKKNVFFNAKKKSVPSFFQDLIQLSKLKLTFLVTFTTILGYFLTNSFSDFRALFSLGFGIFFLVCGACIINCYIEREADQKMVRTVDRPLPAKRMNPRFVLILGSLCILAGLLLFIIKGSLISTCLALISTLLYLMAYTPLKSKSLWSLPVGAIPGALPPLIGATFLNGTINLVGGFLFLILFLWQIPHFLSISMIYSKDYQNARFKVFPNEVGIEMTKNLILFFSLVMVLVSVAPVWITNFTYPVQYMGAVLILGACILIFASNAIHFLSKVGLNKSDSFWAKRYFRMTLFYLPGVYLAFAFFK